MFDKDIFYLRLKWHVLRNSNLLSAYMRIKKHSHLQSIKSPLQIWMCHMLLTYINLLVFNINILWYYVYKILCNWYKYHTGRPRRYNYMICSQYCNVWAVYVGCAVIFGKSAFTCIGTVGAGSTLASAGIGVVAYNN